MVKKGVLLDGSTPVGSGVNGARYGIAIVDSDEFPVVAKPLSVADIDIEVLCAVLAILWNLPALPPLILTDSTGQLYFGATRANMPNMMQALNLQGLQGDQLKAALKPVTSWSRAPDVAAFDEAIGNRDRNLGNILWTGADDFLLIDHGYSLGQYTLPSGKIADDINKMLLVSIWLCDGNDIERQKLKKATLSAGRKLASGMLDEAGDQLAGDIAPADLKAHLDFVWNRLQSLPALIEARFPNGQLLLST